MNHKQNRFYLCLIIKIAKLKYYFKRNLSRLFLANYYQLQEIMILSILILLYFIKMSTENDCYYFIIFPKYLQIKGFVIDKKLPQYSISAYIGHYKVDQISIIPMKEQKLYHTIFWLTNGKLQFQQSFKHKNKQIVRIEVHEQGELLGKVYLNIKEYIKQYEQDKEHYYCEKVKISDVYEMEFQLFMGNSMTQIDNLLNYYHGESDIRTPITKQSQERGKDDSELNFELMKIVESEIYSPLGSPQQQKNIFHKIDEQQSINSSVPQSAPAGIINNRFAFKINLNEVTSKENSNTKSQMMTEDIRKFHKLSLKEKLTLGIFGGLSFAMIYLSMIPLKKI